MEVHWSLVIVHACRILTQLGKMVALGVECGASIDSHFPQSPPGAMVSPAQLLLLSMHSLPQGLMKGLTRQVPPDPYPEASSS